MNSSLLKISILVVDDDSTSLAIISSMLKQWRYEDISVATVKTPVDALSTLRAHPSIDLVVTDLHMPEMNGIELQRQINQEFKVPVIIMSSDDKESVMLKSLAGGAVFFIVKPVNPDDLKNVWQYTIAAKKGKSVFIEEIGSIEGESSSAGKLSKGQIIISESSVNDEKNNTKRRSKRKASRKDKDDQQEEEEIASSPRKGKVVWTNSLHNQFLEALRYIGLEKAVPKKILEHMNVQGLTRENVASHLQKYRIFLKRVAERSCFSSKAFVESVLKSSIASGHPLLLKTAQEYSRLQELKQMRGLTSQAGYGRSPSAHNAASLGSILFPNQNASSSNSAQPQGYGQYCLLGNQANKRQVSGKTNPLYQGNSLGYANGSNLSLNGGLYGGLINVPNGSMNGANSMHTYQQQIQARPYFYTADSSSQFRFGSPGLHSSSSTLGTGNIGSISTSYPTLNSSCTNNNTYAGIRLTTDGQLTGMGQTRLNGGYGSMNGTYNQNMNFEAMGNQTFRFNSQGEFSSTVVDGAKQVSPTYTAANQQANTSVLPGLGNLGVSDYNSDHPMNNDSNLDNISLSQQPGDSYPCDVLSESNNYQFLNEQQVGGDSVQQKPEFASSSLFPEIYPTLDEIVGSEFLSLEETAPWCEQALGQVQSGNKEFMNTSVGGGEYTSDESYPTNVNQNTNQQQSGEEHLADSELSSVFRVDNAPTSGDDSSDNQNWGDDFVDSMFGFGPHFE
ncbi:two-component response regulator ORR21-like [Durio zibethinus]|uniref:Two-component response regulator ORR21-like n=1 Tax=Durio zibethinus TaxID=66656 RepID=A0A6P5WFL4_DURZI|nr:two-component response regulator ORR21-like [Durio zibethinus]